MSRYSLNFNVEYELKYRSSYDVVSGVSILLFSSASSCVCVVCSMYYVTSRGYMTTGK